MKFSQIFLQYGSNSNIYFLSWYGFTLNKNPEKIQYEIFLDEKKSIKLNNDLDLYQIIIEISNFFKIFDFENGFFCFEEIRNKDNYNKNKGNFNEKINKILFLTNKLQKLIEQNLKGYYNNDIKEDFLIRKEAEDLKDFNLMNISNVIIEEKTVK